MYLLRAISLLLGLLVAGQICFAQTSQTQSDESQSGQVQPDTRKQYQVEIIAFQYLGPDSSGGETFDKLSVGDYLPTGSFDIDRYNKVRETISYTGMIHLSSALERLQSDPRFSVMLASAWVQPLLDKSEAIDVPLGEELPDAGPVSPQSGESYGDSSGNIYAQDAYAGAGPVSGTLRVFGDYLLFADLNLEAKLPRRDEPKQPSDASYTGARSPFEIFHISEKRRIKLDEFNYFDHPYIGAIVSVTRHEGS